MDTYPPTDPPFVLSRYQTIRYANMRQGLTFSAEDVLEMTRKTRELLPTIPLSVTVPHTLDLDDQVIKHESKI